MTNDDFFVAKRSNVPYSENMAITTRQTEILHFIANFQAREGFPPSVREICKALGLVSPGSLLKHLRALELQGLLSGTPGRKRAWKLTGRPPQVSVPLIGRIAAGTPILAEENRETDLPVDPKLFGSEKVFALWVKGDSMIDAQIRDGDFAIIRPQNEAEEGEIVAVLVEGVEPEATLKALRRTNEGLELHSANDAYPPLIFKGSDQAKVRILGKLVGIIRPRP